MYDDPNRRDNYHNHSTAPEAQADSSPAKEQPHTEYHWQGSTYSSSPSPYTYQPSPWQSKTQTSCKQGIPMENTPPKPKRKKKGLKILAASFSILLCCALVSAGTLTAFVSLLNQGTITLANTGTTEEPTYTIHKLMENNSYTAASIAEETASVLSEQEIAEKILPSIVCIQNYQIQENPYGPNSFGNQNGGSEPQPAGEGSGIIASSDGYIITNAHVVSGATSLKAITYGGESYEATLVGSDSLTDLAMIKIEAENLPAAEFGSSGDLQIGDLVVAAGNPGGMEFSFSITVGYVSALDRPITNSSTGYTMECIQTDAAVNPGNSGGALVNEYGQVVGIVSSKIVADAYEGLSFAIPTDTAQGILNNLKAYGYVKDRAVLGVNGGFVDEVTAKFYGLASGWYISEISSEYVTQAGIEEGDVITEIEGVPLTSSSELSSAITKKKPGETIQLTLSRASTGKTFTTDVVLSELTGQ